MATTYQTEKGTGFERKRKTRDILKHFCCFLTIFYVSVCVCAAVLEQLISFNLWPVPALQRIRTKKISKLAGRTHVGTTFTSSTSFTRSSLLYSVEFLRPEHSPLCLGGRRGSHSISFWSNNDSFYYWISLWWSKVERQLASHWKWSDALLL